MTDRQTVLVLSSADDPTAGAVVAELSRRSAPVVRMDLGDFPAAMTIRTELDGRCWRGELTGSPRRVDLADVRSIYYRRPTRFAFPDELSDADRVFATEEARLGLGGVLAAMDVLWVNDPIRVASAEYKPLQLAVAARCGLMTPATLITNDHRAVIDFASAQPGPIVCKALSPIAHSEDGDIRITFTTVIDPLTIDKDAVAVTAHLFQAWVPKDHEVRVTMVGGTAFAVAIDATSDAARVDWRSDYDALVYTPTKVPEPVLDGISRYLGTLGLSYGAFDFIVKPNGEWVFLECNPAGQWLWLERLTELPIAAAFADVLIGGRSG
ncbi:Glutathione synthase/Ribosomal protein S6 modification enzyme (glutaminyl transferase) [Alloactinosynnema sp. L-07]|uniref:ATP-grasp ribosomal peptide maturase n=1 Tax=Alloactinosynnema sp. L-07 TaxID=1653480 RepID=UPI00065F075B|nr:ATP-grasp ribosomal peptide maturase [Alloactinosynnema sp. L-07]CRK60673.1 Glutathione synthase/Ribosomal protein S6 modification enzyme (glutaminyl transferase) [Alloactinosynnema sp. L-07]